MHVVFIFRSRDSVYVLEIHAWFELKYTSNVRNETFWF